jgi:membrane-associated phospholipid phosphatase
LTARCRPSSAGTARLCAPERAIRFRALLHLFRAVSWLGDGIFWYSLMLALLLAHGATAAMPVLHVAGTGIVCTLLYRLLKKGTLRPRPYQVHAHIAAGSVPLDKFSFPSGHTLHAVGFCCRRPTTIAPAAGGDDARRGPRRASCSLTIRATSWPAPRRPWG